MSITSGFFNSKNGDRKYNAEHMSRYFDRLITSGIFPNPSTQLQVVASEGMILNILPGRGIIDCHWIDNDSNHSITIEKSDAVLNRIDAVVMKLDLSEDVRDVHIEVKKGTLSNNPAPPGMTRSTYVQEYCLATVYVGKLVDTIRQSDITDTRADTTVCGWVTGLIDQVDTSALFRQWQSAYSDYYDTSTAAFDAWFEDIRKNLSTATLMRTYNHTYMTSNQDERVIPIDIPQYDRNIDILQVYINGLRLIPGTDYSIDSNEHITLIQGVIPGTPVSCEVYKSLDGEKAETVIGQVESLQTTIASMETTIQLMQEKIDSLMNP